MVRLEQHRLATCASDVCFERRCALGMFKYIHEFLLKECGWPSLRHTKAIRSLCTFRELSGGSAMVCDIPWLDNSEVLYALDSHAVSIVITLLVCVCVAHKTHSERELTALKQHFRFSRELVPDNFAEHFPVK